MATYFVDGTNGSDANNGLAAASGGGNGPVATLAKAIAAGGLAASGDTVKVAPKNGGYRESVTVGITPASEVKIIGDPRRKEAWAATTPNGPVIWNDWLVNDYTAPSGVANLIINGKHFLTFEDIWFVGNGNPTAIDALSVAGSHNLTFRRCLIQGRFLDAVFGFSYKATPGVDPVLMFDRCLFIGGSSSCSIDCPQHATTDYTTTITHKNCYFYGINSTRAIEIQSTVTATGKPLGPWLVAHCTFAGTYTSGGMDARNGNWAAAAVKQYNDLAIGLALNSGSNTTVYVSDYNRSIGGAAISGTNGQNDMPGGNSNHVGIPLLEWGQSALWDLPSRPFHSIWPGGPVQASFGESTASGSSIGTDLLGRPNPAGGFVPGHEADTTVTGTATSGANNQLTKTGAGWTVNAFTGYILTITGGTGAGQRRWVASNTATVLTPNYNFITAPDATSTFSLDAPGAGAVPGCYAAHDMYLPGGAANADGGSGNCVEIPGPGNVRIRVAVPASATVISVKVKWDANHADTNKPRAIMLWQPAIGVDDAADTALKYHEIVTATGTAGSGYETLTFASITPTAAGYVTLLLQSRSAKGNGIAYFDTVGVA